MFAIFCICSNLLIYGLALACQSIDTLLGLRDADTRSTQQDVPLAGDESVPEIEQTSAGSS